MKKINVIVCEATESGMVLRRDTVSEYKDFYKLGGFDIFNIVRVEWDGYSIGIFIDDECMLKSGNLGRMVNGFPSPLFGNLVITGGVDEDGETLGVPEDIDTLMIINKYIGDVEYVVK